MKHEPAFAPLLMQAPVAAAYLGVSATKLRALGIQRKVMGGNRLYDRRDLDAFADALPYEGEDGAKQSCDQAFGVST